jgi:ABC-type transport system involved in multi-copper enzyme maturation permease subunit
MIELLRVEFTKIAHRRLNHVVLAVFLALLVVLYVLLWMVSDVVSANTPDAGLPSRLRSALYLEETVPFAMLMLYTFGFVCGVVVVGANVGGEYTWNTIRMMTAAEPRRWRVLLAKLMALWTVIVCSLLLGLAVTLLTSALITVAAGEFDLSFVDAPYLRESLYQFLRVLVGTAPYFALAALLATYGKSATAGIALALGVAFLEGIVSGLMTLSGGWLADLARLMLDANADSLALASQSPLSELMGSEGPFASVMEPPSVRRASTVLLVWASVFAAGAFWAIRRQDLDYHG